MSNTTDKVGFNHFELKTTYDEMLAAGQVDENDISFVKDAGEIHVLGGTYGGVTAADLEALSSEVEGKQEALVSGTNIKTINGESVLGEGDIVVTVDTSHLATKAEVIDNEEVAAAALVDLDERVYAIETGVSGGIVSMDVLNAEVAELRSEIQAGDGAAKADVDNLTQEVIDNEEVTAAALVDLDERVSAIELGVSGGVVSMDVLNAEAAELRSEIQAGDGAVKAEVDNLTQEVIVDEEVAAAALADLDERVSAIEEASSGGGVAELMTAIAYADLVALRDAGNLVAGMKYRITDYETMTSKAGSQSAGHPFDIIVTALDGSTLDEKASAIQSARDTDGYFANSNLEAWDVRYCLDNDTDRFDWAVAPGKFLVVDLSELGVGSVQASPNGTFELEGTTYYRWDGTVMGDTVYVLTVNESPAIGDPIILYLPSGGDVIPVGIVESLTESTDNGFGVVYRLIDDKQNDVPYDFKNIQFVRKITDGALDLENGVDTFCYTFSDFSTGVLLDASENAPLVSSNSFETYCWDNVMIAAYCDSNTFGNNCRNNTFGNNCSANTFGDGCSAITFGNGCYLNTFGDSCGTSTFGDNCGTNTFGNYCNFNTFGDSFYSNTFGNNCRNNTFGDNCGTNTFGNSCQINTFGDSCEYNTFGNYCSANTFATTSDGSAIANSCKYNTLGQHCGSNIIWNASGNIQHIEIKSGVCGTGEAKQAIAIPVSNAPYVQTVAKNSSGEIKIYCEADLIS